MQKHYKQEKTLVVLKPDALQRSLIGEIIKRYERVGLKLSALKFLIPSEEMIEKHYTLDPNWKKNVGEKRIKSAQEKGETLFSNDPIAIADKVVAKLKAYMSSGPVVAMVWQGAHAVAIVRKITGGTEPLGTDVGTIRGDFVLDSYVMADGDERAIRNLVHASGSVSEAENEIALWFTQDEVIDYNLVQDKILYDVNLDGIKE
jgi:nucleoside-diphosphate kinase